MSTDGVLVGLDGERECDVIGVEGEWNREWVL